MDTPQSPQHDPQHDAPHDKESRFDHAYHAAVERYERGWLMASFVMLIIFTALIMHAVTTHGSNIARAGERNTPEEILALTRFTQPGIVERAPGKYDVNIVAQAFLFMPPEIRLPLGAEATFYLTSRDVIHGYQIENTNINIEVIPGEIAVAQHTFSRPGEYRVTCNQYCGIGHHNMVNKIIIEEPAPRTAGTATAALGTAPGMTPPAVTAAAADDWQARGQTVFSSNCSSCHQANGQGVPGAFPPVAGHAADIANVAGGRDYLINLLLYGLQGPIRVNGTNYNGVMPGFGYLSNEDVAATVNHIALSLGSATNFAPVTAPEVEARRNQGLDATQMHGQHQALGLSH